MIGRTIGNYVVKSQIGQGGMGAVYLAEHPRIRKQVAIKVLLPEYSRDPLVVARFFNEAKAANEIHNEHIIDIIDFGELPEDGASYIIMEWLDGKALSSVLQAEGKLPTARAIHICKGIARALSAAHARGIVHRDLKPDNIFLVRVAEDSDFVKVLDFGIAKLLSADGTSASDVKTQTGAIIGTPSFMSPEQCRGVAIDHRTDIYALGVIVYEMLTGRLPFTAQGLGELLLQHMTVAPQPPRELEPSIPPNVERAVLRALEKEVDKRWQHVDEMLRALADVQTGAFPIVDANAGGEARTMTGKRAAVPQAAPNEPTLPPPKQPTHDTLGQAAGQAVTPPAQPAIQVKKRTGVIVGGVVGAAALAAVAVVATQKKPAAPPAAPAAPAAIVHAPEPPAPRPAVAPPPAPTVAPTPPPAQASTAHVIIRATPKEAQLLLDGGKVENPFEGTFPRNDVRHSLMVKAPGYRSETQWVTFAEDSKLEIALQKGSGSHERKVALPAPPPVGGERPAPPETRPEVKPAAKVDAKPETKPAAKVDAKPETKSDPKPDAKPVYKGTKGKLITEFPE